MDRSDWLSQKIKAKGEGKIDERSREFSDYLNEISTYHWERLAYEPRRLVEENARLEEETENLTFANYKTFIQVADCSKNILKDFVHVHDHVDKLLNVLPVLELKCQTFSDQASKINLKRSENSLALKKHTQLLEILEIPQVMDTCVRAGYYEQALELANYASKLERRLGHISLIQSVVADIKNQRELLLENLLDRLSTSLNLATCLKVVSYLRRLNVFSESELRIKFLMLRGKWLDNVTSTVAAAGTNSYDHVTRVMELLRVNMFDVISQYKAAFPDDDYSQLFQNASVYGQQFSKDASPSTLFPCRSGSIFSAWILAKTRRFSRLLETDLKTLFSSDTMQAADSSRLDSILTQFMHFGLSLSRVGCDIRYEVAPIFLTFVETSIKTALESASEKFVSKLLVEFESSNFAKPNFMKKPIDPVEVLVAQSADGDSSSKNCEPPSSLMQSRTLSLYCNWILITFNNFRSCIPLNLTTSIVDCLNSNLNFVCGRVQEYKKKLDNPNRKRNVDEWCQLFFLHFMPFLNICLRIIFPPKQIAFHLGVQSSETKKIENLVKVDIELLKPILIEGS